MSVKRISSVGTNAQATPFGIVGCALQRGAAELSDPRPSPPAGAVSLGHSQDSKTGHGWGTVFGSANCIGPHWDIPMLGEGPDGRVPPVSPTRRVSGLERPQPSPGWGRFLVSFWEHRRLAACKSYRPWHQAAFRGTGIFPNGLSRLMLGYPPPQRNRAAMEYRLETKSPVGGGNPVAIGTFPNSRPLLSR